MGGTNRRLARVVESRAILTLYVVATPIGNLEDITLRAKRMLGAVDFVAAEDTRRTGQLLQAFGLRKPLISFRDGPSAMMDRATAEVVRRLATGDGAFVTDAGTPGVSDPGWRLVAAVRGAGHAVVPIPGSSAVTTLLATVAAPLDEYRFVGFLPKKKGRQTLVRDLVAYLETGDRRGVLFFESPNRLDKTLREFQAESSRSFEAQIGRELTKQFESIYSGRLTDEFIDGLPAKGEYTVLLYAHE